MKKKPEKPSKDAWKLIETTSTTWAVVRAACLHGIATAGAIVADPLRPMVDIRSAQGDLRAYRTILALAERPGKQEEPSIPAIYPGGFDEDD